MSYDNLEDAAWALDIERERRGLPPHRAPVRDRDAAREKAKDMLRRRIGSQESIDAINEKRRTDPVFAAFYTVALDCLMFKIMGM